MNYPLLHAVLFLSAIGITTILLWEPKLIFSLNIFKISKHFQISGVELDSSNSTNHHVKKVTFEKCNHIENNSPRILRHKNSRTNYIPNPDISYVNPNRRIMNNRVKYCLGNQIFVFASLYGIARRNCLTPSLSNEINLGDIFNISAMDDPAVPKGKDMVKFGEKEFGSYDSRTEHFGRNYSMSISMVGYYQSWRYFIGYESELRPMLTLLPEVRKKAEDHLNKMIPDKPQGDNHIRVGIHVHSNPTPKGYIRKDLRMVPKKYYNNAMAHFQKIYHSKEIFFIVFSDDIEFAKKTIRGKNVLYSESSNQMLDFAALAIMDHMIMSVGSFGWWAAWISNGTTIYYKYPFKLDSVLYNNYRQSDFYPALWIPME